MHFAHSTSVETTAFLKSTTLTTLQKFLFIQIYTKLWANNIKNEQILWNKFTKWRRNTCCLSFVNKVFKRMQNVLCRCKHSAASHTKSFIQTRSTRRMAQHMRHRILFFLAHWCAHTFTLVCSFFFFFLLQKYVTALRISPIMWFM